MITIRAKVNNQIAERLAKVEIENSSIIKRLDRIECDHEDVEYILKASFTPHKDKWNDDTGMYYKQYSEKCTDCGKTLRYGLYEKDMLAAKKAKMEAELIILEDEIKKCTS